MDEKIGRPEEIHKRPEWFKVKPHLEDYDKLYSEFDMKNYAAEIEFFKDGTLNVAHNALDRHLNTWRKNKVALIYDRFAALPQMVHFSRSEKLERAEAEGEGGDANTEKLTFQELALLSNKFANVLKTLGIKKGDRVFIFLPRVPEVYVAFFGALKVGAIASTLFSAFGLEALIDRLGDSKAKMVITNPALKSRIDKVVEHLPDLTYVMVVGEKEKELKERVPIEVRYEEEMGKARDKFECEHMKPSDPCFMLYTSGTTGKAKGVVHTHGALIQQHLTAKWVLDLHDEDLYWCTADHGWVTGISYGMIAPLSLGATSLIYDGRFDPEKWYSLIEKRKVTIWYTAPTAIRMLMKGGDELVKKYDTSSLRHLFSVGEPLNPECVKWGMKVFGLPFHDTWWQTETGAITISNYPSLPVRPGSMGKPVPGVVAEIVDDNGNILGVGVEGNLALKPGFPALMAAIWNDEKKYHAYFKGEWYISGDRALKDADGYIWFVGRADDVIKTSGERVGPFEVESVLVEHPAIAEAGVIGKPDALRGEIVKAFVTLRNGYKPTPELEDEIKKFVKQHLAGHAYPREISFVDTLPKTRSGKIMRRVLRAKEMGLPIGDLSTMGDE